MDIISKMKSLCEWRPKFLIKLVVFFLSSYTVSYKIFDDWESTILIGSTMLIVLFMSLDIHKNSHKVYKCVAVILGVLLSKTLDLWGVWTTCIHMVFDFNDVFCFDQEHKITCIVIFFTLLYLEYKKFNKNKNYNECIFYFEGEKIKSECMNFSERHFDLRRVCDALKNPNIRSIGIEGSWGTGKTYLVDKVINLCDKENYEVINIDVLAINEDGFIPFFLSEIDKVLFKNRILSMNSSMLEAIIKDERISKLYEIIDDGEHSYSKIIDNLNEELKQLDKSVLIVIEDIDRINENEIKKIFYIGEKICSPKSVAKNVKIIYQYSLDELKNKGLSEQYCDKYIQYNISLSNVDLSKILEHYIKKNDEEYRSKIKYNLLSKLPPNGCYFYDCINLVTYVERYFKAKIKIRTVKNFLEALNVIIPYPNEFLDSDLEIIYVLVFMEYFMPDMANRIKMNMSLNDALKNKNNIFIGDYLANADKSTSDIFSALGDSESIENFELLIAYYMLGLQDIYFECKVCANDEIEISNRIKIQTIERLASFVYESNHELGSDYLQRANAFTEIVLSDGDDLNFDTKLEKFLGDKRSRHNILVSYWSEVFQSFKYASIVWGKKKSVQNYNKLINVYAEKLKLDKACFDDEFISDTIELWEGIENIDQLKIVCDSVNALVDVKFIENKIMLEKNIKSFIRCLENNGIICKKAVASKGDANENISDGLLRTQGEIKDNIKIIENEITKLSENNNFRSVEEKLTKFMNLLNSIRTVVEDKFIKCVKCKDVAKPSVIYSVEDLFPVDPTGNKSYTTMLDEEFYKRIEKNEIPIVLLLERLKSRNKCPI